MKIYIFLVIILAMIGVFVFFYKSKEQFANYSSIIDANKMNEIFMYPSFILKKSEREERDKNIEDVSNILTQPKPSKLLRGVDEFMAVKYGVDNIYDATSVNSGKELTHNLTNW